MQEGYSFSNEAIPALSPYLTEHINRLGRYPLDLDRHPPALEFDVLITQPAKPSDPETTQIPLNLSEPAGVSAKEPDSTAK